MPTLFVEGLHFDFPEGWLASKYDDWSFYRNQFIKQGNHIGAVDILTISSENNAFLIEVKDYCHPETIKPSELAQAIANKVFHTLAALLPAKLYANDPVERQLASAILNCASLKVVLHIEQPHRHSPVVDLADLKQKTRRLLRAIDPHLKIVTKSKMQGLAWSVT